MPFNVIKSYCWSKPAKGEWVRRTPIRLLRGKAQVTPALTLVLIPSPITPGHKTIRMEQNHSQAVTPMSKNCDQSKLSNCQLLTLTSVRCTVLKHVIFSSIIVYFDQHKLIFDIHPAWIQLIYMMLHPVNYPPRLPCREDRRHQTN